MTPNALQPDLDPAGDDERGAGDVPPTQMLLDRLEWHVPEVYEHARRTARLAAGVCGMLGVSRSLTDVVVATAELHDVGKLAIARELLRKSTPLDAVELRVLREHAVLGYRLLKGFAKSEGIALMVRATHECYDGTGYPDRLAGEAIPLPSRIVAACDAFDAMTEGRLYRPRLSQRDALAELRRCAGSQFDPAIVHALDEALSARPGLGRWRYAD